MNREEATAKVLHVLGALLNDAAAVDALSCREDTPKWDSLKHIELMFTLEEEFDVEFAEDELAELDSVPKIVAALAAKHAA